MAEISISITKKQSDLIDSLWAQVQAAQSQLNTAITAVVSGSPKDVTGATNYRTDHSRGVYSLIVTIPDAPKDGKKKAAQAGEKSP